MLPAHLNPFRTSRLEELPYRFPPGWTVERLLGRLEALGGRGAVVGPHGSGKSSLIRELARELHRRGFSVTLARNAGELLPGGPGTRGSRFGPGDAVLLDVAGTARPMERRRMLRAVRRAGIVVITAHRPGPLPTLIETAASAELLLWIVARLHPPWARTPLPRLARLLERYQGDLHRTLLHLYDTARRTPAGGPLSP